MNTQKKTVLIVDDDADYLFQMKATIESFGFEVLTAENEKDAEKIIEKTKPDLCILDLMMENQDSGFILCFKIKRKYRDVPIIMASAVTAETGLQFDITTPDEQKWIKADLFLDKGIRPDQLHREINKLLKI